jgi:DNA-binding CsgD family transcriptional regulator
LSDLYVLAYAFTAFVVGMACLGAAVVLARSRQDELAQAFLGFYVPLSVLVLGALLLGFMDVLAAPSARMIFTVEYVESFVGRYGVMLALPLFAHRVFGTPGGVRTSVLVGIVLAAFVAQHITEFVLGGPWDARGDVAEDLLFAAIVAYTVWLALKTLHHSANRHVLAKRFVALLLIGVPVAAYDLFLVDGPGLRFYPFWYCIMGLAMLDVLIARHSTATGTIPAAWDLSPREKEVVRLVQLGLSNRDVAVELTISPNTVKTHLGAIFDKSGFRTRAALIAALAGPPGAGERCTPPGAARLLES